MTLSAREQQALDSIKAELADSDPRLAGFMATFTRLVSGEEMPLRERIWAGSRRAGGRPGRNRRRRSPGTRGLRTPVAGQWLGPRAGTLLLLWLLISVALIAVAVILSHGGSAGSGGCAEPWPAVCAGRASSPRPHPSGTATSRPSAPVQQLIPGG
jgi:hypothetical protein